MNRMTGKNIAENIIVVVLPLIIGVLTAFQTHPLIANIYKIFSEGFWVLCVLIYAICAPWLHFRRLHFDSPFFNAVWEKRKFGFPVFHAATIGIIVIVYWSFFENYQVGDRWPVWFYNLMSALAMGGCSMFWASALIHHTGDNAARKYPGS